MDNKTILPDNDLTERRSRRRISSILKAPRSPLGDLGIGNELHQESIIDKRRKSSRRVSFAETIRVFTPELKSAGAGDADSGGVGTASSFCKENASTDGKCPITGMDRLLHGPLQAPAHQAEWNNTNCNKEQTIYFSSDNDMDMTAINTVAIDGLIEEKPRKINTSLFLASLRAPTSEDSSKFLTADEKLWEFQPSTTSSTQSKIKFDFLASLKNESITSSKIGVDKENIFPFVSKENLFSTKTTPPFFNAHENTGNLTCVFRDQEDGLDLTKCHTTNIASFIPTVDHQLRSSANTSTSYSSTRNKLEFSLFEGASVKPPKSVSIEQTLLCEDDMDMTSSHTTRIHSVLKENAPPNKTKTYVACNNQKTIIFTDENEMELTENNSVFFNSTFKKESVKRDSNVFFCNQDTVCPEEDMAMTRSHTVAIDGLIEEKPRKIDTSLFLASLRTPTSEDSSKLTAGEKLWEFQPSTTSTQSKIKFADFLTSLKNEKTTSSKMGVDKENIFPFVSKENLFSTKTTPQFNTHENTGNLTCVFRDQEDGLDLTKCHTTNIASFIPTVNHQLTSSGNPSTSYSSTRNKLEFSLFEGASVKPLKSVSIEQTLLCEDEDQIASLSNPCLGFNGIYADPANVLSGKLSGQVYRTIQDNITVFPSAEDDMELTKSHTIDSKMSLSDSTHKLEPILKAKKSNGCSRLSTIHNRTDFFSTVGDDMELTQSHTTCINQNQFTSAKEKLFSNAVNQTRHVLDDMEMTMVQTAGLQMDSTINQSNNYKTMVFTCDQQDMDITQSHTVAIDGDTLLKRFQSDTCLAINQRDDYILAVPRCLPDKDFVLESKNDCGSVGKMDLVKEETLVPSNKSESSFSSSPINITNMSCQKSTGPLKGNTGVFISNQEDMDMTCGNTVHIKRILLPGDSTNKAITHAPCPDKTVVLEDDMEYTKSHTAVIDGINAHELRSQSGILKTIAISADMDITKSNTVFIDSMVTDQRAKDDQQNKCKNTFIKLTGPSDRIPDDLKITVYPKQLVTDEAVLSKDNMFNSLDQKDMDLSRTNTIAIENKVLGEVEKLQASHLSKTQICFADMDITKSNKGFTDHIPARMESHSVKVTNDARVQINETSLLREPSKNRLLMIKTSGDEENLVELPSKHFVNNLPCEQIELDLSSQSYVFTGTSKRESISHRKSFCIFDETVHQICNMSETTANIDLVIGNNDKRPSKGLFDQTCNQGEMEITKCHTTAIESKMGATPNCPVESNAPVHQATSLFSKDMPVNFTVNTDADVLTNGTFTRNKGPHQTRMYECVLPCKQATMESPRAHIAVAKVNSEENCCENSRERNHENVQVVEFVEMSTIPFSTSQKCENYSKRPIDATEKKGSKQNNFSESLPSETLISSEEMAFTQFDSMVTDGSSGQGKKTTSVGIEKTCLFLETAMDVAKSNTAFIDQEFKDVDRGTCRNEMKRPSSIVSLTSDNYEPIVLDHKNANTKMDMALDDKYVKLDGNALPDHSAPSIGTETILHTQTAGDHKPINAFSQICDLRVSSETGASSASQKQETIPENLCSEQSEAGVNYPGAVQDCQVTKKHRLSKRVSFCFSETDRRVGECVVEPNTEITLQNRKKMFNAPNNHSDCSQYNPGKTNEQTGNISVKLDFTDQVLVGSLAKNNQYLNCSVAESIVSFPDKHESDIVANVQEDVSLFEPLQKEKNNRRRSIADIQLKIRSLTEKTNKPSNHTAPVSYSELSTLPQTLNPTSGNCMPEQTLLNEQVSKDIEAENRPIGKGSGQMKETSLQNRLSVNMLQPKLPSKRHSSTCNLQELAPSTISKPPTQICQTSMSLKAFADGDSGHCIDEEMLPACLDDHDGNSLFQYEVPEGAWEELCEKEALHTDLNDCLSKDPVNSHKRARDPEDDTKLHGEKRVRRNDETQNTQTSVGFKSPDECSRNDFSSHTSKTMEQTYCSSSSHDSRGEGMSELSSQQYSQMDSQLPCDNGYGQKFQDGTITVKEFFMLLGIRSLIQKPRCSELPVNRGNCETLSATDLMLDLFIYQPKLQVYEEECHTLYQTTEELKLYTDMQDKPLTEVSSLLWEEMRMCSENELMLFGTTLKNRKSMYAKKSKILAHEAKVSIYSKLLHKAQVQVVELQSSITETAKLIEEVDDCLSSLQIETARLEQGFENDWANIPGIKAMQFDFENMVSLEQIGIREKSHLEKQKEKVLTHLGCLQDEARGLDTLLQEPCFAEWDMVNWTDTKATFAFLYDSLELTILFGDEIDGETFNDQLCRRISRRIFMSQLNEETAPPSSLLVHRLIIQFLQKKGYLHETCEIKTSVPQLLFDVSLVVSRCKLLGEEVEYLMKWGAKYNIVRTDVKNNEVKLLFSSTAAFTKFELGIQISAMYPTDPLSFTVLNRIGNMEYSRVAAAISKVPLGLWLLKRSVKSIHEHLLV